MRSGTDFVVGSKIDLRGLPTVKQLSFATRMRLRRGEPSFEELEEQRATKKWWAELIELPEIEECVLQSLEVLQHTSLQLRMPVPSSGGTRIVRGTRMFFILWRSKKGNLAFRGFQIECEGLIYHTLVDHRGQTYTEPVLYDQGTQGLEACMKNIKKMVAT